MSGAEAPSLSCGPIRRDPDGSWWYGDVQIGTDDGLDDDAFEAAVTPSAPDPDVVPAKVYAPKDAQLSLAFEWPESPNIVNVDASMSLREAHARVWANLDRGAFCPCCQRMARRYARRFHREMAVFLVYLVRAYQAKKGWHDLRTLLPGGRSSPKASTDGSYLVQWGLVKRHPKKTGVYRPTEAGIAFVYGRTPAPKIAWVYGGRALNFSRERVYVREVLGDRIDVLQMLRDVEGPGGDR